MLDVGYDEPSSERSMKWTVEAGAILICRTDEAEKEKVDGLDDGTQ